MEYPIQKFIELVTFDQQIHNQELAIKKLQQEIEDDQKEFKACQESSEQNKMFKMQAKKEVDQRELSMKELDNQEKIKLKRLDEVESQKEYQSLKNEIDQLKQRQQSLEQELVAAWKKYETAQSHYEEKKSFCEVQLKAIDSRIADRMKNMEALKKELNEAERAREGKIKDIPQEWLDKYAIMRSKVPNPVVAVMQESCSACFFKISQKDLIELKKNKLLLCRDCFRFLYMLPDNA